MSRDGSVTFVWGDGSHRFRLAIGDLIGLEEKLAVSPFMVLARLRAGVPMIRDAREVLRFGLIGGGVTPIEADRLILRWCDERPPAESLTPSIAVLMAALHGVAEDDPGKSPEAGAGQAPPPATA